jgi:hypothetical protein
MRRANPDGLFHLAATASGAMVSAEICGPLLVAHALLLAAARRIEAEVTSEAEWAAARGVLDALAEYLARPSPDKLERLARAWLAWTHPPALH